MKYLSGKIESTLRFKRELVICGLILVWIVISGIGSLPPLVYVSNLGDEAMKSAWVTSPDLEPPFGHAELVSLQHELVICGLILVWIVISGIGSLTAGLFCKKQRIPLDRASPWTMSELRKAGFTVDKSKNTLAEIAESKDSSGMGVYAVIKKLEEKPEAMKPGGIWTAETVEETFAGTGLGNKTMGQIIKDMALNPSKVYQRLKIADIEAQDTDRLKSVADQNATTPIKIMTIILVENRQIE